MNQDRYELVTRMFGIEPNAEDVSAKELRQYLVTKLTYVIAHEFGKLPQLLYQLDVPERKVSEAFEQARNPDELPELLADLILERVEAILMARQQYEELGGKR